MYTWDRCPGRTTLDWVCFRPHRGGCSVLSLDGLGPVAEISQGPHRNTGQGDHSFSSPPGACPSLTMRTRGPSLYPHWRNSPPCGPLVVLGTSGHSALFSVLYCGSLSLLRTFISLCLHSSVSTCFRNSVSSSSWYSEQTNLLSGYDTRPLDCGHRDAVMSQTRPVFTCSETDCSLP